MAAIIPPIRRYGKPLGLMAAADGARTAALDSFSAAAPKIQEAFDASRTTRT
jgi:hypothetical protein